MRQILLTTFSAAMLFQATQLARAEDYIVIGPSETDDIDSLDFDSIKRIGPFVEFTERSIYSRDPKWNVPEKHHSWVGTLVGNCDNETIASYNWRILDPNGIVVGHGETSRDHLQFSHDPDSETLLLKIACSRMKLLPVSTANEETATQSNRPAENPSGSLAQKSDANSPPDTVLHAAPSGKGYTEYRSKTFSVRSDDTGKGAVLCAWSIYSALPEVGRRCFSNNDDIQQELTLSLRRIDGFIIKNSSNPVTKTQLNDQESHVAAAEDKDKNICRGEAAEMYQRVRSGGAAGLHASVDQLLSVPREPVMNPCL